MKVLLVNGGPHKEGCTYTALNEVAGALCEGGVETEILWVGNKPVAGCIACGVCGREGRCFRDDSVNGFVDMAAEADGFVFGSPVHFASACGPLRRSWTAPFMLATAGACLRGSLPLRW